jgi:hypothetical protein
MGAPDRGGGRYRGRNILSGAASQDHAEEDMRGIHANIRCQGDGVTFV